MICGIDPGGQTTGIVVRDGRTLVDVQLVVRGDDGMPAYLAAVIEGIADAPKADDDITVAVEGLVEPSPHMGLTSVRGLIDTAQVLGAVLLDHPAATVVRPGGHGAVPKQLREMPGGSGDRACRKWMTERYPAALVGDREWRGTGALRHARAAWDVAGAAGQRRLKGTT